MVSALNQSIRDVVVKAANAPLNDTWILNFNLLKTLCFIPRLWMLFADNNSSMHRISSLIFQWKMQIPCRRSWILNFNTETPFQSFSFCLSFIFSWCFFACSRANECSRIDEKMTVWITTWEFKARIKKREFSTIKNCFFSGCRKWKYFKAQKYLVVSDINQVIPLKGEIYLKITGKWKIHWVCEIILDYSQLKMTDAMSSRLPSFFSWHLIPFNIHIFS